MAIRDDLTYAARSLRKTPGLVSVIVLTLALGIGVNTTAFNLLNLLVLAPPSAKEPGRLLRIEPGNSNLISYLNFRDIPGSSAFTGMALESATNLNWRNGDVVEPVRAMVLSANFFSISGTSAWLGRAFTAEESAPERNPNVVVLSYEFWERRFEGDRDVLGRTLNLNGRPFTVIGVMGRGYRIVMNAMFPQMFVPIGPAVASGLENRQAPGFFLVARLAPGVGREEDGMIIAINTARNAPSSVDPMHRFELTTCYRLADGASGVVRSDTLVTSENPQCVSQVWEINEADIQLTNAL